MRAAVVAGVALVCALIAGSAAADVADFIARPIAAVMITVDGHPVQDPKLVELLETTAGAPLTMTTIRESIVHLYSLGRFEDVRVEAEARGNQVALTYVLVSLGRVRRIEIAAPRAPGVDPGDLRQQLLERFGSSPLASRMNDMAAALEQSVKSAGYFHATVAPREERIGQEDETRLLFQMTPGPRSLIGTLDVRGDAGVPPEALYDALDVKPGIPYEPDHLSGRIERFIEARRKQGYYEAHVTVSPIEADTGDAVNLVFTADRGPRVKVVFAGDQVPSDRRDDLVSIAREGSAAEDVLEDATNRIEAYLRSQGYRDAVAPHNREQVGDELQLTFTVAKGPQYRIASLVLIGNDTLAPALLQSRMRVRAGQPFSENVLDADLAQIEDVYHREGFAQVAARASLENDTAAGGEIPVAIEIRVTEGPRTIVNSVQLAGASASDETAMRPLLGLQPAKPYFATQLAIDRDAIQLYYANLGYPSAAVSSAPGLNADSTRADVVFTVRPGVQVFVDHVLIVGNERTRTSTIERELRIKPGDPLGLEALNESQRRLASLGLFRRARIAELGHGDESRRDVLVTVEEAPVTTVGYGGGLEVWQQIKPIGVEGVALERLQAAPRAFFEVGRRNLFGKNRSVNLFTRVSLRRTTPAAEGTGPLPAASTGFTEYRVIGTFREPRVFNTAADAFFTGALEQEARASFNFSRRAFTAEVGKRLTPLVSISGNYQIQRTELFDEQIAPEDALLIDRAFPQLRLSSFGGSVVRDTRDDRADPTTGQFYSINSQFAARAIGSEVGFIRNYLTAQTFHPVPHTNGIIFAGSARLGLAAGFPRFVPALDQAGLPIVDSNGKPVLVESTDIPASERFFAGGDTTVRGFALDQLGTPETIDKNGFPIGGRGLLIFNGEFRVPVRKGFGVVGFVDTGNVFASATDISLAELRTTLGFGVRYKSPIGPIRVDLGFKTDRRDISPGIRESLTALHISLGQAF